MTDVAPPMDPNERALKEMPLVLFDLDGTLFDLVVDWSRLLHEMTMVAYEHRHVGLFKDIPEAYAWSEMHGGARERMHQLQAEREMENIREAKRLDPGTRAARWRLRKGMACSLFTLNTTDTADALVGSWGFYPVVTVDRVRKLKPDPEGLLKALRTLGTDPGNAAFVGNAERDLRASVSAGVMFIDVKDIRGEWFA